MGHPGAGDGVVQVEVRWVIQVSSDRSVQRLPLMCPWFERT